MLVTAGFDPATGSPTGIQAVTTSKSRLGWIEKGPERRKIDTPLLSRAFNRGRKEERILVYKIANFKDNTGMLVDF